MTPMQRLRKYVEQRKKSIGIEHEHIHSLSLGAPSEAILLLSDIEAILTMVDRNWKELSEEEMQRCCKVMGAEPLANGWVELVKFASALSEKLRVKNGFIE